MFLAEACGLLAFLLQRSLGGRAAPDAGREEAKGEEGRRFSPWVALKACLVPAVLDMSASGVQSMGFVYVSASVYQMLRGCNIVFTAVLSVLALNRRLTRSQVLGICLAVPALAAVGAAGIIAGDADAGASGLGAAALGVSLIIFAQLFQGCQVVWEEKMMAGTADVPPLLMMGTEGCIGTVVMLVVAFPLLAYLPGSDASGSVEFLPDTLAMLGNSPALCALVAVYVVCIFGMNCCGFHCTKHLSALTSALVETGLRTMFLWAVDLYIYYAVSDGYYGEPWEGNVSLMQAAGFAVFLVGSLLYGEILQLPADRKAPGAGGAYVPLAGELPGA